MELRRGAFPDCDGVINASAAPGATPEAIVQRYSTLTLSDVYAVIAYYLRHRRDVEAYLARREQQAADDLTAAEGHQVYADPAGHPFCLGWGHPDDAAIRRFLRDS